MGSLKLYPSGFVGPAEVPQTEAQSVASVAREIMSRQPSMNRPQYTASAEVAALYDELCNGYQVQNTFEFREKILRLAAKLFKGTSGTGGWMDWVNMQHQVGEYSDSHRRWVQETIVFIENSTPRITSNQSWTAILTAGDNIVVEKALASKMQSVVEISNYDKVRSGTSLEDWLLRWVMSPGGVYDLAQSLNVVYGRR
jgi:hypothetical protein